MDDSFNIQIPTDDEGYLALACPQCAGSFKIRGGDYQERDVSELYCPNCGLLGEFAGYLPADVIEVAKEEARNRILDEINRTFKDLEQSFRSSKFIKFKHRPIPQKPITELRAVTDLAETELPCCETSVKLPFANAATVFYCPFCGQAQS